MFRSIAFSLPGARFSEAPVSVGVGARHLVQIAATAACLVLLLSGCDNSSPYSEVEPDGPSDEATLNALAPGNAEAATFFGRDRTRSRLVATLTGEAEVDDGDPDGFGTSRLALNPARERICFDVNVRQIAAPTRGHIHRGVEGENGPIEVFFFDEIIDDPIAVPRGLRGCVDVGAELLNELTAHPEEFYINIHNDEFPAGAIRGQLRGNRIERQRARQAAILTGEAEVGEGDPDGSGRTRLLLNAVQEEICFDVNVRHIAAPTRGHIHRGVEGENGPIEVFFFDEIIDDPIPVPRRLKGCVDVRTELLEELSARPEAFYVNIHNEEHPAGAVRGQLRNVGRPLGSVAARP